MLTEKVLSMRNHFSAGRAFQSLAALGARPIFIYKLYELLAAIAV
jgi:hypothetical protein